MPSGFIDIKAGKGQWKHRSFESGTVSASIDNRSIILENCHFRCHVMSYKDFKPD